MQWTIPGTTLLGQREDADRVDSVFRALFLAGLLLVGLVIMFIMLVRLLLHLVFFLLCLQERKLI